MKVSRPKEKESKVRRSDRELIQHDDKMSIIKKCKVCRIAMIEKSEPYIVPMNYGFKDNNGQLTLYFHCAKEGRKLNILRVNPLVCFEIDCEGKVENIIDPCNSGYYYESIIGKGIVSEIASVKDKNEILSLIVQHQANQVFSFTEEQSKNVCILCLKVTEFSGKRKLKK